MQKGDKTVADVVATTQATFPLPRECPFRPPSGYATMRSNGSATQVALYNGNPTWLITRHEDIRAVLGDSRFSSDISHPGYPIVAAEMEMMRFLKTLVTMDPPEHTALRRMVISEFTTRRMNSLRAQIQPAADALVDAMLRADKPVNLAEAYSFPLAGTVIGNLLGIPVDEIERFMSGNRQLMRDREFLTIGGRIVEFKGYLGELVVRKQHDPADDVLSRIVERHVVSGVLAVDDLTTLAFVVMGAGYNPTASMLSLGAALLLENPDQLDILLTDPTLMPGAVEELLRYVSVSDLSALRVATADVEIGGQLIRAGEGVVVPNGAANHDPAVFDNPDRLDVRRHARQHLAFGHGIHQCLGANLVRVELEIALETLFTRIPTLRLAVPFSEVVPLKPELTEIYDLPVTW